MRRVTRGEFARRQMAEGRRQAVMRQRDCQQCVSVDDRSILRAPDDDAPEHKLTAGEARGQHRGITGRECS